MLHNSIVYHKKHLGYKLRVVSPASSNGYKVMICEILLGMTNIVITDDPSNFYPA
jgi:hypothetical protein